MIRKVIQQLQTHVNLLPDVPECVIKFRGCSHNSPRNTRTFPFTRILACVGCTSTSIREVSMCLWRGGERAGSVCGSRTFYTNNMMDVTFPPSAQCSYL